MRPLRDSILARSLRPRLLPALLLGVLLCVLPLRVAPVRGASMEPTLRDGQVLCYHALAPRLLGVRRGEIVVFRSPLAPEHHYVKRVVGLPGDELRFEQGRLLVNGVELGLPAGAVPGSFLLSTRVPDGCFFALGDHGSVSLDSRRFGSVPYRFLVGRVLGPFREGAADRSGG